MLKYKSLDSCKHRELVEKMPVFVFLSLVFFFKM